MIKDRIKELKQVEWRKIKPLQPDNSKILMNYDAIEKSILKHGFSMPFFGWENKGNVHCIDGHSRLEILSNLENVPETLPVILIDAKDKKEAQEILIEVFNQKHNPFDLDVLQEWVELEQLDVDLETINVKIDEIEVDEVEHLEAEEDDFDATPPSTPITVLGDLYEIGEHRLLCGDSTDSDQVAKLMNGQKADMVFTDPPYNIGFGGSMSKTTKNGVVVKDKGANQFHEAIHNDKMSEEDFYNFISDVLKEIKINCIGAYYICFGSQTLDQLLRPFIDLEMEYKSIIIWMKNQSVLSGKDYKGRYEPILYGRFNDGFYGERFKQEDIWEFQRTLKNELHPTMKPIPLIENALNNSSKKGMIVLDLFLGSGSTMVASHQLKRKCYGMELDCRYADVIVKRMLKLDKTLKIKKNGIDETEKWLKLIE